MIEAEGKVVELHGDEFLRATHVDLLFQLWCLYMCCCAALCSEFLDLKIPFGTVENEEQHVFKSVSYSLDQVRNGFFFCFCFFFNYILLLFLNVGSFSFQANAVREHLIHLY